jgi:hypothetical protein
MKNFVVDEGFLLVFKVLEAVLLLVAKCKNIPSVQATIAVLEVPEIDIQPTTRRLVLDVKTFWPRNDNLQAELTMRRDNETGLWRDGELRGSLDVFGWGYIFILLPERDGAKTKIRVEQKTMLGSGWAELGTVEVAVIGEITQGK